MLNLIKMNCNYLCFFKLKSLSGAVGGILFSLPIGIYLGIFKVYEIIEKYYPNVINIIEESHSLVINMIPIILVSSTVSFIFMIMGANLGNFVGYKIGKSRDLDIQKVKLLELIKMNCNGLCFFKLRSLIGCLVGILFILPIGFATALLIGGDLGGGCTAMIIEKIWKDIGFLNKCFPIPLWIGLLVGFPYTFLIILIIFIIIGGNTGNLIGWIVSKNIINPIRKYILMK